MRFSTLNLVLLSAPSVGFFLSSTSAASHGVDVNSINPDMPEMKKTPDEFMAEVNEPAIQDMFPKEIQAMMPAGMMEKAQEEMMENPALMQEVQVMMKNPALLLEQVQAMMMSNPALLEQVQAMMSNPAMLEQVQAMTSDPAMSEAMMN